MPRTRPPASPSSSPPPRAVLANRTSTVLHHTIAPFYACYLLRSFAPRRRAGTYIGSTPDPPRRWKQHMGLVKGGAFKTRLGRPWEMEAIVTGFPTKLQALQFEWAWQNPHASRLLHRPSLSLAPGSKPEAQFPRSALSNRPQSKLQVLQFMLTVPPWRAFPLAVTLFSDDARAWWDAARRAGPTLRTEAGGRKWERERLRDGSEGEDPWGKRGAWIDRVRVELRREGVDGARLVRAGERREGEAVERIRVDDGEFFDAHWTKWSSLDEAAQRDAQCGLCSQAIDVSDHLSFHLCTASSPHALAPCTATFHPACLAAHLVLPSPAALPSAAPASTRAPPLLPVGGACPACSGELRWAELVRGAYRRKEEVEGRRKRRTMQRGVPGDVTGNGKGKGKAVEPDDDEEGDDGEGEDDDEGAFLFSDPGSGLDSDSEDSDEAERSFARLDAADGAQNLVDADASDEEVEALPLPPSPRKRPRAPRAAAGSPPAPKKRGRFPRTQAPSIVAVAEEARSPWDELAVVPTPRRRMARSPSPPAAVPPAVAPAPLTLPPVVVSAKRRGRPPKVTGTLTGAFASSKAALSAPVGRRVKDSLPPGGGDAPNRSDSDEGVLLPPSALGARRAPKAASAADGVRSPWNEEVIAPARAPRRRALPTVEHSKPHEAGKASSAPTRRKKVEAYIELSD